MKEFKIQNFAEQHLVLRSLVVSAKHSSESMEKLAQWMLAGFGAGLIYLLGKDGSIKPAIDSSTIKTVAQLYLYAILCGGVQRIIAMVVANGTNAFQEAEKLPSNNASVDLARFYIIYIDTLSPSVRWVAAWTARRFLKGMITDIGRGLFYLTMIQTTFGFVTAVFLVRALYIIISHY